MKRHLAILLCLLLFTVPLSACGGKDAPADAAASESEAVGKETTVSSASNSKDASTPASAASEKETSSAASKDSEQAGQSSEPATVPASSAESSEAGDATTPSGTGDASEPSNAAGTAPAEDKNTEDAGEAEAPKTGASKEDAIPIPLDTKIYGTATKGNELWYTFTVDEDENAAYKLALVNKTAESGTDYFGDKSSRLEIYLYQSDGRSQLCSTIFVSGQGNIASDGLGKNRYLPAGETCYLKFKCSLGESIDFMVSVTNMADRTGEDAPYELSSNLLEAKGTGDALAGNIHPGKNADDAQLVPLDTEVRWTTSGQNGTADWFAFTTGGEELTDYIGRVINLTTDAPISQQLFYDELGNRLGSFTIAQPFTTYSGSLPLRPNSTYYLSVVSGSKPAEYTVSFNVNWDKINGGKTSDSQDNSGDLIFETPFELNETQVRFVSNKATFFNENDAKAALAPVAEVLLAHPGHPILIAGTTATVGQQASTEALSLKRADAAKNLLVNSFGVPESQIVTVGLGYKRDPFVRGKDIDSKGRFVESEAAKNRRVVIIDINDPIAQKLLNQ